MDDKDKLIHELQQKVYDGVEALDVSLTTKIY